MTEAKRRPLAAYAFAVLTVGLATLITWAFPLLSSRIPFALFYAAVLLSTWYGGKRAGLLCTALSSVSSAYFFLTPEYSLAIGWEGVLLLSVFLFVSLVIVYLTDRAMHAQARERASREQLLTTLRSIGDAVIATDARGLVTFMNPVAEQLTGWTNREAEGKDLKEVFQIVNEETRQEVESPVTKAIREGTIVGLANHTVLLAKDGREIPIDDSGAPIRDEEGILSGVVLVFRDITERRRTDEVSRRLASIVESSEDAIIGKTLDGIITNWNAGAERLYGYALEEVVGRPISILVPPERPNEVPKILERLRRGERIAQYETTRVTKDGQVLNVALSISPIKSAAGKIIGASTIARDITERKRTEEALRASEDRYRAFVANSSEAIWRFELDEPVSLELPADEQVELYYKLGYLAECNDAMAEMYGFESAAEIVGLRLNDFLVREDPRNTEFLQAFIHSGYRLTEAESHETDREGKQKYFLNNLVGIIEDGRLVRAWGTQRDITERRVVEAAMRESEARFRRVVESNIIGISFFTLGGEITDANDAYLQMLGRTREELESGLVRWDELTPPEYRPLDERAVEELRTTGVSTPFEKEQFRKDGSRVPVLIGAARLAETNEACVCFIVDLTEQKRAANRTARLQAITAALSGALTPQQAAGAVLKQGLSALGAVAGSVAALAEHGGELELLDAVGFPEGLLEKWQRFPLTVEAPLTEAVRTGEMVLIESLDAKESRYPHLSYLTSVNGSQSLAAVPLVVEGRVVGGMGLTFSAPRTFEEDDRAFMLAIARQCAQAIERARLYQAERRMRAEAETANRTKDEFLATLSHELRTPLTAMLGWTRMLRMKELDEATSAHALETVERNAKAQAQLIEDLLDVSRIITGKLRLDVRPVDLVPVIEAAIDAAHLAAEAKGIELRATLDPLAGPVSGDPARLQQVAWNLLANAVKFTPRGGRVEIRLAQGGEYAEIEVSDTGQGIAPEFLPYVFDRFRQADSSTTRLHGGLGLGLAIVRHLVELHGGTVHAESEGEGRGATFKVQLPVVGLRNADFGLRIDEEEHSASSQSATRSLPADSLKGVSVLVVDDELDARELIRTVLEKQGATVVSVAGASEALAALAHNRPDVLVSDIGMPDEDGYSLIRRVRSLDPEKGGQIPAAAVSAYVGEENRRLAAEAGFQLHVAKPLDPEELVEVVRHLAEERKSS